MLPNAGTGDEIHPFLRMAAIEKRFGGVRALTDGALTISRPGEAHALVGANGSGKSTLLGILSGQQRQDAGSIELAGSQVKFSGPRDAVDAGIVMVSQETSVVPELSVAENILLGHRQVRGKSRLIDWKATRERAGNLLDRVGLDLDLDARVGSLTPDQQQLVEICRALSINARLLILDEPTSSLTDDQSETLFRTLRTLAAQKVSLLLVSHYFQEIYELCDQVTVLKDGATVLQSPIADTTPTKLVDIMVGSTSHEGGSTPGSITVSADPRLTVSDLVIDPGSPPASLSIKRGEILGLAGLVGSGRSELLQAIFGVRSRETGHLTLDGASIDARSPRDMIRHHVGYLPPDRKADGLVLQQSIARNLSMVNTLGRSRLSPPRRSDKSDARRLAARLRLKFSTLEDPVRTLSGGNQQKVAIGKWLMGDIKVLLLDEPTRGVDVAAKAEIHALLTELAEDGMSIVVSSGENEELLALCHRILVMSRGRITHDLRTTNQTAETIADAMGGHA